MTFSGLPLPHSMAPHPTWALKPCTKLPHTMQMFSSSLSGSDALPWAIVTTVHRLGHSSHPAVPWHPGSGHPLLWTSSLTCSGCPSSLTPTPAHWGLLSSAPPNAIQIFLNFKVFWQISTQRDSINSYPTINVREPIPLTLSNGMCYCTFRSLLIWEVKCLSYCSLNCI